MREARAHRERERDLGHHHLVRICMGGGPPPPSTRIWPPPLDPAAIALGEKLQR
jgi:hypothetical protein